MLIQKRAFNSQRQVSELRQLKEEEEVLMWRAATAMQQLYTQICQVREQQGYWSTSLELTVLQKPPEEVQWSMVRQKRGE